MQHQRNKHDTQGEMNRGGQERLVKSAARARLLMIAVALPGDGGILIAVTLDTETPTIPKRWLRAGLMGGTRPIIIDGKQWLSYTE